MEDKYWLVGIVVTILALLLFYISVRFMFALPQLLFEKKTVKEAVRYSLEKTRKHSWFYTWNFALDCRQNLPIFHSSVDSNPSKSSADGWSDP